MSGTEGNGAPEGVEPVAGGDPRTEVRLAYQGSSGVQAEGDGAVLALFGNTDRAAVRAKGRVKDPMRLREALSALNEVVSSDFRYKPKDRSAWLAYQRMRKQSTGMSAFQAQKAYFEWLSRNDPTAWMVLDPVVSVFPDELSFEVFSKDEGTWARLALSWDGVELDEAPVTGTTNIDFSDALNQGVQRLRSYRSTRLSIGSDAVAVSTEGQPEVMEKRIQLPDSWLRGFLQVQSAATLPATTLTVAPMDLYNLLRHLRLNADQKRKPRGLRVELVPGEVPRLVLEPWEAVLETHGAPYKGRRAQVIRVWGRRRLSLLRRFLPFVDSVDVHLLGSGLPSFWVLRGGPVTLTLGMTGFTAADWAQAVAFDTLLPRSAGVTPELEKVMAALGEVQVAPADALAKATGLDKAAVLGALQLGCQQGAVMYDLAGGVYRLRPLLAKAPDLGRLEYRSDREKVAHDLFRTDDAVKVVSENTIFGEGVEITGKVAVAADRREYRPQFLLTEEGVVRRVECTCNFYRQNKLKQGPCAHLIALRLAHADREAKRKAQRGKGRASVTFETRTYVKRHARGEDVVQVSLDRQRLRVQWGQRGDRLRSQQLLFNSVTEARRAYFTRVDDLEARGFLDASAS